MSIFLSKSLESLIFLLSLLYNFGFLLRKVDDIVTDKVKGFLLNSPSPLRMMRWEISINYFKHWYAVCRLHEQTYYNLDSKLTAPQRIGEDEDLKKFILNKLQKGNTELLIVVCKDTTKEEVLVEK